MLFGAPFWAIFVTFAQLQISSVDNPSSIVFSVVLWAVTAYVAYLGLYVWFGLEVIRVDAGTLVSERHLFGMTTRRRAFETSEVQEIRFLPTTWNERFSKLNLHVGLDEGTVAFTYRGDTIRIAEGLYHDDEKSKDFARRLTRIVESLQNVAGTSPS